MDERGAWRTVAALAGLNLLSFIDRQLLAALVTPLLIAELGLSRAQIGLLVGLAFMSLYAVGTLAAGVLADRWSRPRHVAAPRFRRSGAARGAAPRSGIPPARPKSSPQEIKPLIFGPVVDSGPVP